jgi:hypothetical protein
VAGSRAILSNSQAPDLNLLGFKIGFVDAIVANQRIGRDQDLASEGRVREHFLITGHTSVENDLTIGSTPGTKGLAFIVKAIFEN